ncbi:MAG: hypothetical protein ACLSB9_31775 [Hydrogeniiclostridium mannosilyticum]
MESGLRRPIARIFEKDLLVRVYDPAAQALACTYANGSVKGIALWQNH